MAEEEQVENGSEDQGEEGKKKKSPGSLLQIINLVLMVLVLILGGFIAWKLVTLDVPVLGETQVAAEAENKASTPGVFMELDNVTVNLADVDESRFLRAKIKLEVEDDQDEAVIEANKARIKDLIITVLSSKTFDDVRTPQGKFALKEELAYRINRSVGGHPVRDVFFMDFVAQ